VGDGYDYLDDGSSSEVDVLRLTDLNQADVDFMRSGLSLILIVQATGETIFINNQFNPDQGGYWGIERMEFADGSAWDNQQISEIGWIRGTAGNDNLVGTWRQEILEGGAGDDSLSGDWGNDTYIFNAGDGNDTIHEWGNPEATDVLQLGTGINAGSVAVGRGTGGFWDIVLNFGTAGAVTSANGFYGAATVIEEVRFADNTVWTLDDLQSIHLQQAATASDDTIYGFIDRDDVMDGSSGNDSLTGFSGNDTLSGGVGDDSLSGDDGNDILIGGAGNDSMAGGAGSDAFVFKPGFGLDTIADFTAGTGTDDVLEFDNTLFADFEAVLAAASQVGSDTVIAFDVANMVTLKNVTLANLHADDVRFVA
jgi:Ca2+-binding RTX toxin-like protein